MRTTPIPTPLPGPSPRIRSWRVSRASHKAPRPPKPHNLCHEPLLQDTRSRQVKYPYEPQRSNYSRLNGQDRREKISEQVPLGTFILRVKQWPAQQSLLFHTLTKNAG